MVHSVIRNAFMTAAVSFALLLLVVACSDGAPVPADGPSTSVPMATVPPAAGRSLPGTTPSPAPSPGSSASSDPSGARAFEHVVNLASDLGPRVAGSVREKQAAEYLAQQLRGFGYDVEMQPFSSSTATSRESALSVRSTETRTVPNVPFAGSGEGLVRGPLISAGGGAASEFGATARGGIILAQRGEVFFREMAANAEAAGARGLVVANNTAGAFFGSLETQASIPVVSISQLEGQRLTEALARGAIEAELRVIDNSLSVNVIARPPGRDCETVTGGHYDTVASAPGASDNASGTAVAVEVAQVLAERNRMGSHCFVMFAAEEPGLIGSRAFVNSLDSVERGRLKVMVNFDMAGFGNGTWNLIASPDWLTRAQEAVRSQSLRATQQPMRRDSDHWSFASENLPVVWLYAGDDPVFHTPRDTADHIHPELLEQAARFGVAFLESISGS